MDGITMQPHLAGHAGVCEIILDRPEVLNAINTAMATRLAQACAEPAANPQTRAVVLSAAGTRAFCVGADLKERNSLNDAGLMAHREVSRAAFGGLLGLPQPVIAAVHGYALGGGCELALSCDLIVADETAVFGLPETTVGLVPGGGGTQLAQRRLGQGRAADLIFTGRQVPADEAQRLGMIDRLVPDGKASQHALELAQQIAANSPVAVRAAKRAIRRGWGISMPEALDVEDAAWRATVMSGDRRGGVAGVQDKRGPHRAGQGERGGGGGGRARTGPPADGSAGCARWARGMGCKTRTRCRPPRKSHSSTSWPRPGWAGSRPSRSCMPKRSRRWPTRTRCGRASPRTPPSAIPRSRPTCGARGGHS